MTYRGQEGTAVYAGPLRQDNAEVRTFTCQHCNKVVFVPAFGDPADIGGLCKVCMGLICPQCTALGYCDPVEKKIERNEARGRLLRDMRGA